MPKTRKAVRQWKLDYQQAFSGDAGRRVLRDLMIRFGMADLSYTKGDPMHTAFQEGQRAVVHHILNVLQIPVEPDDLLNELQMARNDYGQET